MKTTATKMGFQSAQATTTLPPNYRHHRYFDLAKSRKAVVGAIVSGIVLFFIVGWLFVQFINLVRPPALEALRSNIQTTTSNGATSFTIPFQGVIIALALVMFIHELCIACFTGGSLVNALLSVSMGLASTWVHHQRSIFRVTNTSL